ncbi:hypothetical protein PHMEG_0001289 [Phytophthora megakarya]|uniref:Uncharacterized protein n=1 Tax=Phytophthora megakarya TaxID=4795 RepID=A0A225X272_9STRA|nr:hypothetical protein PHMEG_0001289 [Phytophthora megakarya]
MSQSSFSQTQSQNLLGSSQDSQLDRLRYWQAQQPIPPSSVCCDGKEKLQDLEQNLTKAFVEHTREQKEQQHELLVRAVGPIKKSIEKIEAKLAATSGDHQQHTVVIGELVKGVDSVVSAVSELRQQNLTNKSVYKETQTTVINEATAMKAALTELQSRVETVEGSVKSCSVLVSQVLEAGATKHIALLSAISASSCPKRAMPAEDSSDDEQAARKRRRHELDEVQPTNYASCSSSDVPRTRTCSPPHNEVGNINTWHDSEDDEMDDAGLYHALNRIEALRAKRRNHQLNF